MAPGGFVLTIDNSIVQLIEMHIPFQGVDATLNFLAGPTLFTTGDLASGYWQVEVENQDRKGLPFLPPQDIMNCFWAHKRPCTLAKPPPNQ